MLEIVRIAAGDAAELAEVAAAAYSDHYRHLWHDNGEWYLKRSFSVEQLVSELDIEVNHFYLARWNGENVGFLKTRTDRSLPIFEASDAYEVERIYLRSSAQSRGIGRALIDLSVSEAQRLGRSIVWLKVMDSSTDAIAFYEKLGFEKCGGERLDFELLRDELRGMYWMKRTI